MPSSIPSTYPLIAVRGVFKSCEIFLISSFSSLSDLILSSEDCFNITRISSKSRHTSPISSLDTFGILKSRLPFLILLVASFNLSTGFNIELYTHNVRSTPVIISIVKIAAPPCITKCFTCGITWLSDVIIYTLYSLLPLSVKSICLIRSWYLPPVYIPSCVLLSEANVCISLLLSSSEYCCSSPELSISLPSYCGSMSSMSCSPSSEEVYNSSPFFLTTIEDIFFSSRADKSLRYSLSLNFSGLLYATLATFSYILSVICPIIAVDE